MSHNRNPFVDDLTPHEPFKTLAERQAYDHCHLLGRLAGEAFGNAYLATHDHLTGLLNNFGLRRQMDERVTEGKPFGILLLDLDRFKALNDSQGHAQGDVALAGIGSFFPTLFHRKTDTINTVLGEAARKGGDEFVVTFDLVGGGNHRSANLQENMQRTLDYVYSSLAHFLANDPVMTAFNLGASIGGSIWQPGQDIDAALIEADARMYEHKKNTRSLVS